MITSSILPVSIPGWSMFQAHVHYGRFKPSYSKRFFITNAFRSRLDLRPQKSASESRNSAEQPNASDANLEGAAQENNGQEARQDRRRSRLLDWNRLRHASVDERIEALRQIREQGRSTDDGTPPNTQQRLTDRLRDKFHIRTRTQS